MTGRGFSQPSITTEYTSFRDTDSFLKEDKPGYYPFKLPSHHQQLRHYISTVDANTLYFISNNEVHAVDIPTRQRERIASVPFVPTCLGAGHGWLCIGGYNKGQCAFINLRDAPPFGHAAVSASNAEVDELLPLDLDPHSRLLAQDQLRSDRHIPKRRAKIITKEIGQLIVNAIMVYKFNNKSVGLKDETVAILSNNDMTVSFYSLDQQALLKDIKFPIQMNHATISPNGRILLAVGDEGQAHFLSQKTLNKAKSDYPTYEWKSMASVRLRGTINKDCCFSTAFSPSGHLCAVASQFGIITIFDCKKICAGMEDDEAVLDIIKSSRACFTNSSYIPGAPRSMTFSPEPWDLLVWAEDHGRVCITDLRDGCRSRQTVDVNLDEDVVERIELADMDAPPSAEQLELEREAMSVRRHQEAIDTQDHLAAVQSAADYMEIAAERRRRRSQHLNTGTNDASLADRERQLLETLRLTLGETGADEHNERPFSINYTQQAPRSTSPSLPISFGAYVAMSRRGSNRNSTHSTWNHPRRRGSVVMSSNNPTNLGSSSHPSSLTPGGSANLSASPSRLTPTSTSEPQQSTTVPRDASPSPLAIPSAMSEQWQSRAAAVLSSYSSQESASRSAQHGLPDTYASLNERRPEDSARLQRLAQIMRERASANTSPASASADEIMRNRYRERDSQRERDRETAIRRERLRALHAASNESYAESDAQSRIDRLNRLRGQRLHQLSRRTGQNNIDSLHAGLAEEDYSFLQDLSTLVEQHFLERDPPSRINGEVGVQGVGFSHDGRYLFVGTEEGIVQYDVNIRERMAFPGISFR